MIGTTLTHYRILEKIGEGGMGLVYKARDLRLGRLVAIKVIAPGLVADADRKARFAREARAASALNHPNIITVYDIGSENGTDYIAMEFVEGSTLDKQVRPSGMPTGQAVDIALQVAEALGKAHRAGIVHRDLKPSNIMVSTDGRVKVLDFGLAKLLDPRVAETDETALAPRTIEGLIAGTAGYMSPEQAEGRPIDVRSDIFSFGSVLYEMISGRQAFIAASAWSTLAAVITQDPPKPAGDTRLGEIAMRCLRKAPDDRYSSGTELGDALRKVQDQVLSGKFAARPVWRASRWHQVAVVPAALIVLGILWMARNRDDAARDPVLYKPQPLTGYEGHEYRPGISVDGSHVAFFWRGVKGEIGLFVKTINIEPPRLVFSGPGNYPVWSPDGQQIAFIRFTRVPGGSPDVRRTDLCLIWARGGTEQMLAAGVNWRGLSWSPDGKWLAFQRPTRDNAIAVFRVEVATGTVQQLTHPDAGAEDEFPAYSSDGRHVAFSRRAANDKTLFLVPVESGREAPLGNVKGAAELAWIPGTTDLIVSMRPGGSSDRADVSQPPQLIRMSTLPPYRMAPMAGIGGGEIDLVIAGISVSRIPPGRLVYEIYPYDNDIWLARLSASVPTSAARIVASTRQDQGARFSPDGRRIVFRTNRSGPSELWLALADGRAQMPLTGPGTVQGSLSFGQWSADASRIFFSMRNGLYEIPASGGTSRRLDDDPGDKSDPAWSADGRFVYFRSNRSGSPQIWRMAAGGGKPVQVTRDGGDLFSLSPDSRQLYFSRSELVAGIWSVPVEGGEEKLVLPGGPYPSWTVGRKGIYRIVRSNDSEFPGAIVLTDPHTGKELVVAYLKEMNLSRRHELSLSADETQMLMTVEASRGADLMMVEGVH